MKLTLLQIFIAVLCIISNHADVPDCTPNPCVNGGTCDYHYGNDYYGNYGKQLVKCNNCDSGYIGDFCEQAGMIGDVQYHLVCENSLWYIECPNDRKIKIVDAVWGRNDLQQAVIADCSRFRRAECYGVDTKSRIQNECNHQQYCQGYANEYELGPLLCNWRTEAYLQIAYVCKTEYTELLCENEAKTFRCNAGKTIEIIEATYGTNEPDAKNSCPFVVVPNPEHGENECMLNVTSKVAEKCDDEISCSLQPSNGLYGDPCPTWLKNLKVEYNCV